TFTATPTNPGCSPVYDWFVNGSQVGIARSTYTNTALVANETFYAVLHSDALCATTPTATSNTITVNPQPEVTLDVFLNVCQKSIDDAAYFGYTATLNNPDKYSIDWDNTANIAGFVDVPVSGFAGTPTGNTDLTYTVPALVAVGTYNGTLNVS